MPIIACDEGNHNFNWHLPKTLSNDEHSPTINAVKKHLRKHETSEDTIDLLAGAREIVRDVSTADETDGGSGGVEAADNAGPVSTKGVADALMRFQGIILSDRTGVALPTLFVL